MYVLEMLYPPVESLHLVYIYRSLLWIREFNWLYYHFLSADSQQLRISAHRVPRLNLM